MQARITRFKMRPESAGAARSLMEDLKPEILGLPGVEHFVAVMNDDGSGYTIALVDGAAGVSAESVDRVRALWHKFQDHLEAMPAPEIYGVIADWRGQ
jgi:hypothetical protein